MARSIPPRAERPLRTAFATGSGTGPLHRQTGDPSGSSTDVAALRVTDASVPIPVPAFAKAAQGGLPAKEAKMTTHIPTIHDLNRKSVYELRAMFQDAASVAVNARRSHAERTAARQTLENIRSALTARDPRP